ncbi:MULTISPECIES: plasmid stabilization protein [unclassified Pseudomonas]|uniref:FitA-like ribbon-helix-helix domain-containing protein n=1 Tax=unclassified Pseudomonas TaxID=196821 RepID=UPI0009FDC039|nr:MULTISPECIES: plasmid stabilization protein [unclassified Pseudomonas]MBD0685033.1 plasmid stabilization protein [Pseudomonas sp. PSB18]
MTSITISNLDDQIEEQLRIAAAHNGHSMEKEALLILGRSLSRTNPANPVRRLGSRIRNRFRVLGGVELDLPARN